MTIKIAISGTHSTGKTTLCKELHDLALVAGLRACLVPEAARMVIDGIGTPAVGISNDGIDAMQRAIFFEQLRLEEAAESGGWDVVVCDRTLMDNIIYSRECGLVGGVYNLLYTIARHHLTTYDYIALTEIDTNVSDMVTVDGVRNADRDMWYAIEAGIHEEVTPNTNINGLRAIVGGLHLRSAGQTDKQWWQNRR